MRKTKIVCTLGPATDKKEVLVRLAKAGMNVARLNMSHGTHAEQAERIRLVKEIREELGMPLSVMLDTKGPEVRVKTFKNGKAHLEEGDLFTLCANDVGGDDSRVGISFPELHKYLKTGDEILADDGNIELKVKEVNNNEIITTVVVGGTLTNRKSLNFPGIEIDMDYLSEADKKDIAFGVVQGVDVIALSFVRSADDVKVIREYLSQLGSKGISLISKIENRQGVNNMLPIIKASEGIMVARGDMGVEIPFEELPGIQKRLIKNCYCAGRTVITATQMLESMITKARPTRAEISDVANAVYDGTSATMLSGETAMGKYPVETVKTMAKIINNAEKDINYKKRFYEFDMGIDSITDAVSHSAASAAHDLNAKAIIALTTSGNTVRRISRFRPQVPIIGSTLCKQVYHQLAMSWGVEPLLTEIDSDMEGFEELAIQCALRTKLIKKDDTVVLVAGVPQGAGNTNLMKIQKV